MAGQADAPDDRGYDFVLVLGGGNALGAFHGGVYQALHESGLRPDWVIGASIGAINGALIAGSEPDCRVATLRAFWGPDAVGAASFASPWPADLETGRRTAAAAWTMLAGRPGIFGPPSPLAPWVASQPSIFATDQLVTTLERIVDFDRLNGGACRFTATAVDLESGDDVVFDSRERRVEASHIRASAALPVLFPPVEIEGRWLVDGGLSANLPLDPVLATPPSRPTLCVAADLLPLGGQGRPRTLGESASRMQDLIFAAQSRRTIERWQMAHAGNREVSVSLVRLAYAAQEREVAGKAMDFSAPTIEGRWAAGYGAGQRVVEKLAAGALSIGEPGLSVFAS